MKNVADNKGLFITGTDTDVGKTYIGSQIASLLHDAEISIAPRKPIESGCNLVAGELQPEDAKQYHEAVTGSIPLIDICPFRFEPAISPQRAARLVNQPISTNEVQQACLSNASKNDFVVIEGAGGFYSPLCEDGLNADLAKSLQLPILLIAENRLGCINQILLTVQAIQYHELGLCAIVLNNKEDSDNKEMNNFEDLKPFVSTPIFTYSKHEELKNTSGLIQHLLTLTHLN